MYKDMSFRVHSDWHKEFKLFATQMEISMLTALQLGFELSKVAALDPESFEKRIERIKGRQRIESVQRLEQTETDGGDQTR